MTTQNSPASESSRPHDSVSAAALDAVAAELSALNAASAAAGNPAALIGAGVPSGSSTDATDEQAKKKKAEKKKPGLGPRWSFILTRGIAIALVWAFFTFAFDPLLRFGLVYSMQKAAGAKVDVTEVKTQFFKKQFPFVDPQFAVREMAVANQNRTGQNLFEFETLDGDLDGLALLKAYYVVNKAELKGLQWDTKRADSGQLEQSATGEDTGPSALDALKDKLTSAGKDWAKQVFERAKLEYDPRNLESVQLAEQLEQQWKSQYQGFDQRIKAVEDNVKAFKALLQKAKGGKPLEKLDLYQQVAVDGTRLLQETKAIQVDMQRLPTKAQRDLKDIDAARKRDEDEIKRKVKSLTLDGDQLSDFLLGPELNFRLKQMLAWAEWGEGRVQEIAHPPKPERLRGEDILFPSRINLPKYLVRLVDLEGQGEIANENLTIKGTIEDISSDPKLLKRPTIMRLKGTGEVTVTMKAVFDRTKDVSENLIDMKYERPRHDSLKLGDADTLLVNVEAEHTEWTIRLRTVGDELTGSVMMVQEPAKLTAQLKDHDAKPEIERLRRIVQTACSDINRIYATVQITGSLKHPHLAMRTNLGESLASGIQRGIGSELNLERDRLLTELDRKIDEKHAGIGQVFGGINALSTQLTAHQKDIEATNFQSLTPKISTKGFDPGKLFR